MPKTTPAPIPPDGTLPGAAAAQLADEGPEVAQAPLVELESDPGGVFVNAGQVDLVLLRPAMVLKPGRVVELEYDPGHRDLRRATAADISAAAAAAAETSGQEQ